MVDDSVPGVAHLLPPGVVPEAPAPLYHYTTPAGLLGIIQGRELWATEAAGLNDLAEVHQGWDFIHDWLNKQDRSDRIVDAMRYVAGSQPRGPRAHPLRTTEGIYICSASTRCDDANQWRLYAGGGRGYAIELDQRIPLTTVLNSTPEGRVPPAGDNNDDFARSFAEQTDTVAVSTWQKVLYTQEEKDEALHKLLNDSRVQHRWISVAAEDEEDWDVRSQIASAEMLGALAQLAQLMKSEGFAGENEYRIIVSDWAERHRSSFRATPHGIVGYARLTQNQGNPGSHRIAYRDEAGSMFTLPIRSVWLGPLLHTVNNQDTVDAFLKTNGFGGCRVLRSAVPLGH